MSERVKWLGVFRNLGIVNSMGELERMSDADFQEKCAFCLDCGMAPDEDDELTRAIQESLADYTPKPAPKPEITKPELERNRKSTPRQPPQEPAKPQPSRPARPPRTESGQIRDQQNSDFARVQQQQLEKQMAEEKAQAEKQKQQHHQKAEKPKKSIPSSSSKEQLKEKAEKLGSEPKDGISIGFHMMDGSKLKRKFKPTDKGNDLVTFVAANDKMFKADGTPIKFNLVQNMGASLNLSKSLKDQGITRSTMFTVDILDD
ncbi:surface protein, putative [Trichomonas vaginalis G3]|uniref:Surface protein, putative n=1 Tax=Trichomonas vaginalis (strain ATCC PRA-98 / G3) TaxID=412133 RepID=A2GJ01_TRIV3|nr:FAS-associated protein family [Trichomonas vaginalis G3]EAX82866.1 surface protein, putative [Trichomonas vaginalis G3]KAI5520070.1 FAS-associated protein family [Trichomonas vaginalis G3]|eukprot:XP_001295796.1 surface protein [Trichomonas vaginalis G3]